ncbi:NACHT domain-containing protein [Floridanema evergladense]|uniref:NACHT domain-containing NTPase n=1 Tax=Floridaenema evergladense BLCC-F167 TaxID=3153639 RepID=A0ABV4WRV6_9CYAN
MSKNWQTVSATPEGIELAEKALKRLFGTQLSLARALNGSPGRSTIQKFFKGETIKVDLFKEICKALTLESLWEEIAGLKDSPNLGTLTNNAPPESVENNVEIDINDLVQEVRQKISASIQKRCGTMRVLDMEQPIGLDDIYTQVNILEKLTKNRRLEIAQLLNECNLENFDRFSLGRVQEERVSGLEAVERHDKLLILGKPGAGKTTFLKWLAVQCNFGKFQNNLVPVFIILKDFAETQGQPNLLDYINKQLSECGIEDSQVAQILLSRGKALVLLDGLDEVRDTDHDRVLRDIRHVSERFECSRFVMTCRIAAREYTFEQFTEVEVADFDAKQIKEFVTKWFKVKYPVKTEHFLQELEANESIKELATNPLLLTLLCLVFEEGAKFPANRSELYKEGLDVLLKKWDAKRNIKRDEVYKALSLQRKEDLLSQIAYATFERSEYFFKQKSVEEQITKYIRNLPNANADQEVLQLDSEVILKSIAAQHGLLVERARGIYSFSHLTFHEYFTARRIKEKQSDELLQNLANHITEKRWREVFLLTVGMLESADCLLQLMKNKIDWLVAGDEKLQRLLTWADEKALSVNVDYKPAAVRSFYLYLQAPWIILHLRDRDRDRDRDLNLDLDLDFLRNRALALDHNRDLNRVHDLDLDLDLAPALYFTLPQPRNLNLPLVRDLDLARNLNLPFAHALAHAHACDAKLKQSLQELKAQLPDLSESSNQEIVQQWWQDNGKHWTKQLTEVMIEHRNIGHDWQFSQEQEKLLNKYYQANKLLVDCLNSDCYVSREVREEIENTLLLPQSKLNPNFSDVS